MIRGFQKVSLVDYPGKVCSTIFIGGCCFRCPYCYNPSLVYNTAPLVPQETVFDHLRKRKGVIDAVCITGGEPTLWPGLRSLMTDLKELGYFVKLDTNGVSPNLLQQFISEGLVDFVAMDVKAPLKKYADVAKRNVNTGAIRKCISIIMESGVDYEFRTTVHSLLHSKEDLLEVAGMVRGCRRYALQAFRCGPDIIDKDYRTTNVIGIDDLQDVRRMIIEQGIMDDVIVR